MASKCSFKAAELTCQQTGTAVTVEMGSGAAQALHSSGFRVALESPGHGLLLGLGFWPPFQSRAAAMLPPTLMMMALCPLQLWSSYVCMSDDTRG